MAMEWEVSKENVQPSKGGRNIGILNQVLKAKVEKGDGTSNLVEQRREFLRAIDTYIGDDPLRPWLRYIKWVKESFPSGAHAELLPLLEKCTRKFQKEEKYREDVRYLRVWIQYADCCAEPRDIFKFLEANNIGQDHALFYEAYATYLELRRSFAKANVVFEKGMSRGATPVDRLSSMYKSFQERMAKRIQRKLQEEQDGVAGKQQDDEMPPVRSFGTSQTHSTRRSGVPRAPVPLHGSRHSQQEHPVSAKKEEFNVFVDEAFGTAEKNPATTEPARGAGSSAQWETLGTQKDMTKENTMQPRKWTDVKIPQKKGLLPQAPVAELNIFVDEEFISDTAPASKERINVGVPAALQVRREDSAKQGITTDLSRDPLLHFTGQPPSGPRLSTPADCPPATTNAALPPRHAHGSGGLAMVAGPSGSGSSVQKSKAVQQGSVADGGAEIGRVGGVGYLPELLTIDDQEVCIEEVRLRAWEARNLQQQAEAGAEAAAEAGAGAGAGEMVDEVVQPADRSSGQKCEGTVGGVQVVQDTGAAVGAEGGKEAGGRPRSLLSLFSDVASSGRGQHEPAAATPPVQPGVSGEMDMRQGPLQDGAESREGEDSLRRSSLGSGRFPLVGGSSGQEMTADLRSVGAGALVLEHMGASPVTAAGGEREGRHEGLVDPTINTKEALADIMSMFKEPLPFEKMPAGSKRAASSRQDHGAVAVAEAAGGFQVYTDEMEEAEVGRSYHKGSSGGDKEGRRQVLGGIQVSLPKKQRQSVQGDVELIVFQDDEFSDAAPSVRKREGVEKGEAFDGDAENRPPGGAQKLEAQTPVHPQRSLKSPEVAESALRPLSQERMRALNVVIRSGQSSSSGEEEEEEAAAAGGDNGAADAIDDEPDVTLEGLGLLDGEAPSLVDIDNLTERLGNQPLTPAGQLILYPQGPPRQLNPWHQEVITKLVEEATPPLHTYPSYDDVSGQPFPYLAALKAVKQSVPGGLFVQLGDVIYMVKACIGHGAFARIYAAYLCMCDNGEVTGILQDQDGFALKRECFGHARSVHVYSDCSVLVCSLREHGTLQDVVNAYLAKGLAMDESLVVFYTIEMLRMMEALHAAGMVHGDFKPDNLLLRDSDIAEWNEWSRERPGCWAHKGLCLIDWGRSIDLARFPRGSSCEGDCMTEAFRCPEMVEGRPWTVQADTYGLCGVVHCLLYGKYMEVEKARGAGEEEPTYRLKAQFKRYWNVPLWKNFFATLLNVRSCDELPPLRPLRNAFEDYLENQPTMVKSLKWLFMKQNTLVFEQQSRVR